MPLKGMTSIRTQSATFNFSKGGSTAIYVDQAAPNCNDKNDGYAWDRPKETIQGAIDVLEPWMEIWIKSGIYQENIVIDKENVIMHGLVQAGLDRVEIAPLSGVPLDVQVGYFELSGVSLVSTKSSALKVTGPGHKIHDNYIEVNSDGLAQHTGIMFNDADKLHMWDNTLNGKWGLNTVGVRVDGTLNASVDCLIKDNFFQNFGTVATAGQGINLNNAQRCLVLRNIFDSCYNGIFIELHNNGLHSIFGNQFYANSGIDIVDFNPDQQLSGNVIQNNYFGYVDWYLDHDHDGIADIPIQCYYNYDYAPLSYPHYQGPSFLPRYVV